MLVHLLGYPWHRCLPSVGSGVSGVREGRSARRVKQPSHRLSCGQPVVDVDSLAGLRNVYSHPRLLDQPQGLRSHLQRKIHPPRKHHTRRPASEKFLNIGGLDARYVRGPGLGPVPRPTTAGIELEILTRADTFDLHPPPRDPQHSRRAIRMRRHHPIFADPGDPGRETPTSRCTRDRFPRRSCVRAFSGIRRDTKGGRQTKHVTHAALLALPRLGSRAIPNAAPKRGTSKLDYPQAPSPSSRGQRMLCRPLGLWRRAWTFTARTGADHPRVRRMARLAVVMPSTPSRTSWLKRWLSLTVHARIGNLCSSIQATRFACTRPWNTDAPSMVS